MEMNHWFDKFAKAAAEGMSRRDSLRRIGGGLLGALGLGFGVDRAVAGKPAPKPIPCEPDITKSPYFPGCGLKCAGAEYDDTPDVFDPDTGAPISSPYARCVDFCVAC